MPTLLDELQSSSISKLIAFDQADVVPGIVNDTFFLCVSGQVGCFNMEVRLIPRIYVRCPEYWEIEVTGTLNGGICLEAIKPYSVAVPLAGITGSKGIEVIGHGKTERFEVTGGCR